LTFARLEEIAGDRSDVVEFDGLERGNDFGPAAPVDTKGGELTFEGGEEETDYNRAQEKEWQHESMPFETTYTATTGRN
jgi:hypothetical protein